MRPRKTRAGVELRMTVDELLSLAINGVQNRGTLEALGLDQAANPAALKRMLAEVYEQILDAHRKAVAGKSRA